MVYFPDPPPNMSESLPPIVEGKDTDPSAADESLDLDQYAPSALYSSWGATGPSASDWGLDPTEFPDPTPPADNKLSGKKSKSKGKQKETGSSKSVSSCIIFFMSDLDALDGRGTPSSRSSNYAAQSGTSIPSANEYNEPEPEPEPEPAPRPPTPEPPKGISK